MEKDNKHQNIAPTQPLKRSRYHPFYLVMLILSTLNTLTKLFGLASIVLLISLFIFASSSNYSSLNLDTNLLDDNGILIYVIVISITSLVHVLLHVISLILLYMKKRFAIKVKMTAYVFEGLALVISNVYTLSLGVGQISSPLNRFSGSNFGGSDILSSSIPIITAIGSFVWILIRAALWFFANKEQVKHDNVS